MSALDLGGARSRAQSSPLGIALIIGITIAGATAIVVVGGAAVQDIQQQSQSGQAEQAMTQFDARAAQVALGDSDSQTVEIGQAGGNYRIDDTAGHVELIHRNWDGSGTNETIYAADMGALVYENGDTTIAYQGGGVWRTDGEGSTMVSPPEFHFRTATLTFPIIHVNGSGAAGGQTSARIERKIAAQDVFPDASKTYDGSEPYENPIEDGNISVRLQSEYCEAWRSYLVDRTEGKVSECDENDELEAQLLTLGVQGQIDITGGNEVPIRGMELDGLQTFEVTLRHQDSEASGFNNLGWSMSAQEGQQEFEMSIQRKGGGGEAEPGDAVKVSIYYSADGGDTYEGWVNDDDYIIENTSDGLEVTVDFLSTDPGSWQELKNSDLETFNPGTQGSVPGVLSDPDDMRTIVQYYFDELGGRADFTMNEQNNANLGDDSFGRLEYDGNGEVVTFLHVTENEVEIRFSG